MLQRQDSRGSDKKSKKRDEVLQKILCLTYRKYHLERLFTTSEYKFFHHCIFPPVVKHYASAFDAKISNELNLTFMYEHTSLSSVLSVRLMVCSLDVPTIYYR